MISHKQSWGEIQHIVSEQQQPSEAVLCVPGGDVQCKAVMGEHTGFFMTYILPTHLHLQHELSQTAPGI